VTWGGCDARLAPRRSRRLPTTGRGRSPTPPWRGWGCSKRSICSASRSVRERVAARVVSQTSRYHISAKMGDPHVRRMKLLPSVGKDGVAAVRNDTAPTLTDGGVWRVCADLAVPGGGAAGAVLRLHRQRVPAQEGPHGRHHQADRGGSMLEPDRRSISKGLLQDGTNKTGT
jgi:hypothetical protein